MFYTYTYIVNGTPVYVGKGHKRPKSAVKKPVKNLPTVCEHCQLQLLKKNLRRHITNAH